MAFPASFPLSSIPRNPDSRLPDQNERKRSKEKQWLNAITQGEDPMASSRHPPPKQAKEPACTRGKGRHTYAGIDRPKSRTKHHASRRVNSDPFSQGRDRDHDRSDTNSGRTTGDGKRHSTGESRRSTPTSRKDTTFMSGGSGPPYSQHGPLSFPKDHLQAPNSPSMLSVAATTLTTKSNGSDDSTSTVKQESHDKKAAAVESFPEIHSLNTVNVNEEQNRYQTAGPILDDFRAPEQISGMSEDFSDTTSSVVDGSSDISSTGTPDTPSSRSSVPSSAIWPMPEHPTKWTKHANVDGQSLTGHNGGPDTQHTPQVGPQGEQSREADVDERQSDDDCGPDCQECHPRHQEVQHDRFLRSQHNSHMYPPGYVGRAPEDVSYHQAGPYRSLPAPPQGRPVPPAAPPPPPFYSRSSWSSMPAAPEPPDLSKPVNTGYELLALKLSDPSSTIKPAYRKFEAMHHRILLHIQDELCELEERVRRLDLLVAQLLPQEDGRPFPASRRAEVHSNNELLVARKHLLGMVFVKLEQYSALHVLTTEGVYVKCSAY